MKELLDYVSTVTDIRQEKKVQHKMMMDIIMLVFFAMLANADDWVEMEVFGKEHEDFLRNYLELPNGIPSHDTLQRVFVMVPSEFMESFQKRWNTVAFMLLMLVITHILLKYTKFGRYLYAIGGNSEAAVAAGIQVRKVTWAAFIVSGIFASIAGMVLMGRLNAGIPNSGVGYETDAITATVIGGTSFSGGAGTAIGT